MKKLFALLAIALSLCIAFTGCGSGSTSSSSSSDTASQVTPVELTVFAAASLTEALNQIVEKYKEAAPHVTITLNLDSSGTLQTQIESGATADLFISAAQKQMDALAETYIAKETRKNLLDNKVVLIVPQNSTKGISSFDDPATDKVSLIALGNSDVPVGQYSEEVFTYLKTWDTVKAKASFGTNVKEVLSQVSAGSVDCGIVYATDAATASGVKVVASAPESSHKPVVYPAAVLKNSANAQAAKAFLDYLSTESSVKVFESVGFKMAS